MDAQENVKAAMQKASEAERKRDTYFDMYINKSELLDKKEQECSKLEHFKSKYNKGIVVITLLACISLVLCFFSIHASYNSNQFKKLVVAMHDETVNIPVFHDIVSDNLRNLYETTMGENI